MKKLLLLTTVLSLVLSSAKAQTFEFRFHGESVADGATVTIPAAEDEFGFGELWCESNPSANPNNGLILKLLSGETATGSATITIEHNTLNASVIKWCMGGECMMFNDKTLLTKTFSVTGGSVQAQFDAESIKSEGYLLATLTASIGAETHSVKIKFTNGQASSDPFWWGYFSDSDASKLNFSSCLGYGSATTIDAAIRIPANHPLVGNGTVKSVRIWLGDNLTALSSNLTLWISSRLPTDIAKADYKQTVAKSALKSRLNEIELTTPYEVNNGAFYIGYSLSIKFSAYPIMGGGDPKEDSWFYRVTGNGWTDFYNNGDDYGKLALQILVDGVELDNNSAFPSHFGVHYAEKGSTVSVPVSITNSGKEPLKSITYTISTNGRASEEQTVEMADVAFNESQTLNIPFTADNDTRRYDKTLTITKVNGVANEATQKSADGSLITISGSPVVVPVVEEFTGTWCGWCTIGYDGMEKAKETFGDKVVLIAVHDGDPMVCPDYNPIASMANGYPSSVINRSISAYPSAGNLNYYINQCFKAITLGEIKASAMWTDNSKNAIQIKTNTKFVYSDDQGQYGIAFALIEDGMKGTGSNWAQSNYLSGSTEYADDYPFWYNSASKVTGLEFNHVAVAAWDIANGVKGSVPQSFVAGDTQRFNFEVDINSNTLIQNKSKLKVVALLIDQTTRTIVNARATSIQNYDATEVEGIQSDEVHEVGRYTLDGRSIPGPQRGLNIIKMSDGTSRKVIVK